MDVDVELLKYGVSLGVGGVLAAMMFFVYRKDIRWMTDAWKGQTEILMQVVRENTAVLTELTTDLRKRNGGNSP